MQITIVLFVVFHIKLILVRQVAARGFYRQSIFEIFAVVNNGNLSFMKPECSNLQRRYLSTNELHMQKMGSIGAVLTSFLGHFV